MVGPPSASPTLIRPDLARKGKLHGLLNVMALTMQVDVISRDFPSRRCHHKTLRRDWPAPIRNLHVTYLPFRTNNGHNSSPFVAFSLRNVLISWRKHKHMGSRLDISPMARIAQHYLQRVCLVRGPLPLSPRRPDALHSSHLKCRVDTGPLSEEISLPSGVEAELHRKSGGLNGGLKDELRAASCRTRNPRV